MVPAGKRVLKFGMRKTCGLLMVAVICAGACAHGAEKMSAADARALIEEVSGRNNLEGDDIHPWHIRLNYEVSDTDKKKHYSGTIEEWWASDTQSRTEYAVNGQWKRYDVTDKGVYLSGDLKEVPYVVGAVLTDVLWPMPAKTTLAQLEFAGDEETIQGTAMRCVEMARPSIAPKKQAEKRMSRGTTDWCVPLSDSYLRIERTPPSKCVYLRNDLLWFQERIIAGEYIAAEGKTIRAKAHIEKLETLPRATGAIFQLPGDATPAKKQEPEIMAGSMNGPILAYQTLPSYPEAAKSARISGTVVLHGEIDEQGTLTNLHAVFGPAALVPASLQTVKQWIYIPLIVNGKPVPVKARINVVYQIR